MNKFKAPPAPKPKKGYTSFKYPDEDPPRSLNPGSPERPCYALVGVGGVYLHGSDVSSNVLEAQSLGSSPSSCLHGGLGRGESW